MTLISSQSEACIGAVSERSAVRLVSSQHTVQLTTTRALRLALLEVFGDAVGAEPVTTVELLDVAHRLQTDHALFFLLLERTPLLATSCSVELRINSSSSNGGCRSRSSDATHRSSFYTK